MTYRPRSRPKPRLRPKLERSEPRILLSSGGLARHLDAHPGALIAEARAELALVKFEGDAHASALAGRLNSGGPSSKASPLDTEFFKNGAQFSFRFNSPAQKAVISPNQPQSFNGFTLTVTPIALNDRTGREVLDLNFQATSRTPLLRLRGDNLFTFGPFGWPTEIPVTKPVRVTGLYFYFTLNGNAVSGYKPSPYFPDFKVSTAPLIPHPPAFSVPVYGNPVRSFALLFGPNRDGFTMNATGFGYLGVPTNVNGMHFDFVVSPAK
jgi:hypothetical protein